MVFITETQSCALTAASLAYVIQLTRKWIGGEEWEQPAQFTDV